MQMISATQFQAIATFITTASRDELVALLFNLAAADVETFCATAGLDGVGEAEVAELIREGFGKVQVIKAFRNTTRKGLKESKEAVERIAHEHDLEFGRIRPTNPCNTLTDLQYAASNGFTEVERW